MRLTKRQVGAISDLIGKPYELGGDGDRDRAPYIVPGGGGFDCFTLARRVYAILHPGWPAIPEVPGGYGVEGAASVSRLMTYYQHFEACKEHAGAIAAMASMKWLGKGAAPPDDHIAIVLPSPWAGKLIHARGGVGVCVEPMATWRERITGFYEVKR